MDTLDTQHSKQGTKATDRFIDANQIYIYYIYTFPGSKSGVKQDFLSITVLDGES